MRTAFVVVALAVVTLVAGLPLLLYAILSGNIVPLYWAGVRSTARILRMAGLRVRIEGLENIPSGTCLFAANHVSNIDPPAIVSAMPRRIAVLAKRSLFAIPIVGRAFRISQYVPVDRGNAKRAAASVALAAEYMKSGTSFLIFPEGTRSPDGRLLPFRRGAFAMAIEAGVPVVPVACSGAHRVLAKNSLRIRPGEVVVHFCPAIDSAPYARDERGALAERVHAAIAAALPVDQQPAAATTAGSRSSD